MEGQFTSLLKAFWQGLQPASSAPADPAAGTSARTSHESVDRSSRQGRSPGMRMPGCYTLADLDDDDGEHIDSQQEGLSTSTTSTTSPDPTLPTAPASTPTTRHDTEPAIANSGAPAPATVHQASRLRTPQSTSHSQALHHRVEELSITDLFEKMNLDADSMPTPGQEFRHVNAGANGGAFLRKRKIVSDDSERPSSRARQAQADDPEVEALSRVFVKLVDDASQYHQVEQQKINTLQQAEDNRHHNLLLRIQTVHERRLKQHQIKARRIREMNDNAQHFARQQALEQELEAERVRQKTAELAAEQELEAERIRQQKLAAELERARLQELEAELARQRAAAEEERREQEERLRREAVIAERAKAREILEHKPHSANQMLATYDAKWLVLRTTADIIPPDSLRFQQIPWPILEPAHCAEQMTKGAIRSFLEHPSRLSVPRGKTREEALRRVVKLELLRWHPDKFHSHVLSKAKPDQRSWILEVAAAVTRALTEIMSELAY